MKCELDGENASLIAKAIQSLSKFGADLYVEADAKELQLRTLNVTHSAAGSFKFKRDFFNKYNIEGQDACYCRISTKACLPVFRHMRQVEHCEIQMQPSEAKFLVQLKYSYDTIKEVMLFFVEDENIVAAVSPENTTNRICGSYKVFNEISNNFNSSEEEITLEAKQQCLTAKNYIEGARVADRFMRSQLKLTPNEFDKYEIATETIITFCLKEFRAFLGFAEAINAQITLNFNDSGSPLFMRVNKFADIECQLIMSTLAPDDISYSEECRETELTDADLIAASESVFVENKNTKVKEKQPRKTKKEAAESTGKRKRNTTNTASATESSTASNKARRLVEQTTLSATESMFNFTTQRTRSSLTRSVDVPRLPALPPKTADNNAALVDENTSDNVPMQLIYPCEDVDCDTEVAALKKRNLSNNLNVTFYDTEETQATVKETNVDDSSKKLAVDCIPQSPQGNEGKRLRSIFSRCFEVTYQPSEPNCDSEVYVPDTDSE